MTLPDTAPPAAPDAPPVEPPAPAPAPAPAAAPVPAPTPPPAPQQGTQLDAVPLLQEALNSTRQEAAENRTARKAAEKATAEVMGVLRQERMNSALLMAGVTAGADLSLLPSVLQGSGKLAKITTDDPAEMATAIAALVAEALEANPKLKAASPPGLPPSGGPVPGGEPSLRTFTRQQLAAASRAELAAWDEDIQKWQAAGSPGING